MHRRTFMQWLGVSAVAASAPFRAGGQEKTPVAAAADPSQYATWLAARHHNVFLPDHVEAFLQPPPNNQWATFDAELGYVPKDSIQHDGFDGTWSIYRYGPSGERKMINYANRPCRINTYGNSFTQCHQVSDGQTWQEQLAAHLGEPIRNFGMGGYGVFQAFCRLRRTERTDVRAPYLIFNIWDDDHWRSLMPCRSLVINSSLRSRDMFHGNPWTHLRVNLDSGAWDEAPNPCPTPQSLREALNFDRANALFGNHEMLHLQAMKDGVADVPRDRIQKLADWAGLKFDFTDAQTRRSSAFKLTEAVARKGTYYVLEKLIDLAKQDNRKLMVLLSWSSGAVQHACSGMPRKPEDLELLKWLDEHGVTHVDSLDAHRKDFEQFRITPNEYVSRYYAGHYSPVGNQFFAYAIKKAVVDWLDPKPISFRGGGAPIDFRDGKYLEK